MEVKKRVQDFYEQVGWQKTEVELFSDAEQFEDLRLVSRDYIHKCHMRLKRYLKPNGKYFLDVASGPIQYAEYLTYSKDYDIRICVDISVLALKEARKKIGNKGAYILADITNLPFKDSAVDAVLSLHTIYHVPSNEQNKAFQEIHRVLKPGASAIVVYSWGEHSPLMGLALYPMKIMQTLKQSVTSTLIRRIKPDISKSCQDHQPQLYFYTHDYKYFAGQKWRFSFDILVWRSLSVAFMKRYIHSWLLGRQLLSLIFWLEDKFPHLAGRLGQYPLFIIKK